MTGKKRKDFHRDTVTHIYQRATHGFVMFYNTKDSLVYFTLFSILAERHKVRVISLCLMHNHVHILLEGATSTGITSFMRDLISWFTRVYNRRHRLSGSLFDTFGISVKDNGKAVRTSIAYVNNNPVEARICRRAEEWRWNFIAYADSAHPYSEKATLSKATAALRRSIKKVEYFRRAGKPLTYERLDEILDSLSIKEKQQLIDRIIRGYSYIDFNRTISFYGSYVKMTDAFSFNTGSEYDLREPFDPQSGQAFGKMTRYLAADKRFKDIGDLFNSPAETRIEYFSELINLCHVSTAHAKKFLHIV